MGFPILIKPALLLVDRKKFMAIFHHQGQRFVASVELPPFAVGDPEATRKCVDAAEEKVVSALGTMLCTAVNDGLITFPIPETCVLTDAGRELLRERARKRSQA